MSSPNVSIKTEWDDDNKVKTVVLKMSSTDGEVITMDDTVVDTLIVTTFIRQVMRNIKDSDKEKFLDTIKGWALDEDFDYVVPFH